MTTGLPDNVEIVELTQHWLLISGVWYRDAWIREDGALRFVAIRDDVL
jgi:hypothetical protein